MICRFRSGTALLAVLALSVGACSDSSTSSGDPLPEELAMELVVEFMFLGFGFVDPGFGDAAGGPPALAAWDGPPALGNTETFSETVPCDAGGTIAAQGTVTFNVNEAGSGSAAMSFVQTPSNCGVHTSQGVYTMNGNPNMSMDFDATLVEGAITAASMEMGGGFSWSGSGGSGTCSIAVSLTMSPQSGASSISGSVCGHNVSAQGLGL